jgi:hypothetical protein
MTNSQTIRWKRLAVEGAAIIASILLAFEIDASEDEVWILVDMQERAIPYLNFVVPTRNILAHHSTNADFISATSPGDYGVLWDDPVFNNLVLYRIYSETAVIIENAALANEAEKIISLIESELARK